ncbi:HAD family hydrolase [Candidatus Magnetominusculus xianensis]|nr:HAD-IA family hydrolase [Candidatus Magnetominusculus xianensis]MBF0404815.1 HAD-IA family hydrolase [Nitrospirota bacterium]
MAGELLSQISGGLTGILFDFGDTLVALRPSREEVFMLAASSIGLRLRLADVKSAYTIVDFNNKYSSIKIKDAVEKAAFYLDYNEKLCRAIGISSHFKRLQPVLVEQFNQKRHWSAIKGVKGVLGNLQHRLGLPLGIVANWDRNLRMIIDRLGLTSYFKVIISSEEAGVEKPNPEILDIALRGMSLEKSRKNVLYVGNEYESDVLCATMAGVIPILIDRRNLYGSCDCIRFKSLIHFYGAFDFRPALR